MQGIMFDSERFLSRALGNSFVSDHHILPVQMLTLRG